MAKTFSAAAALGQTGTRCNALELHHMLGQSRRPDMLAKPVYLRCCEICNGVAWQKMQGFEIPTACCRLEPPARRLDKEFVACTLSLEDSLLCKSSTILDQSKQSASYTLFKTTNSSRLGCFTLTACRSRSKCPERSGLCPHLLAARLYSPQHPQ